jgi:hypothetical protein
MQDMGAGFRMLVVETIEKIRRAFYVQKKLIKAICREEQRFIAQFFADTAKPPAEPASMAR